MTEAYAILSDATKRRQYDSGATFNASGEGRRLPRRWPTSLARGPMCVCAPASALAGEVDITADYDDEGGSPFGGGGVRMGGMPMGGMGGMGPDL